MKLLIELSLESESLARSEALSAACALGGSPRISLEDAGVLVIDTAADPLALGARLGLAHHVSEWLGTVPLDDLDGLAGRVEVEGPIRVRSTKVGISKVDLGGASRRLGGILGKKRGVDIHHPKSDIRVVFSSRVHMGRRLFTVDRASFEMRKNRYMPFVYPASLHPKFARALVNLTRVCRGGRLLDPFSGTGAIVAEAGMSGLQAIGSDFSERMIEGSKENLHKLGVEADLHLSDIGSIKKIVGLVDGIATDPPYGRSTSTKGEKIPELYERSFRAFREVLSKSGRVAMVVPHPSLLEKAAGFELLETHELWVHQSLTRHFCVLKRI